MLIVPYIFTEKHLPNKMIQQTIKLLCQGGTEPWIEDDIQVLEDALVPNGIYGKLSGIGIDEMGDRFFFTVCPQKTQLADMYTYDELAVDLHQQDTLCWRTFIRLLDSRTQKEWIGWPNIGSIRQLLDTIVRIENTA